MMDDLIRAAIAAKQMIAFTYHELQRIAEPHIYGTVRGRHQLLTYQVGGESRSGALPNWRRVNLSQVSNIQLLNQHFGGPRPTPTGRLSHFDEILAMVT